MSYAAKFLSYLSMVLVLTAFAVPRVHAATLSEEFEQAIANATSHDQTSDVAKFLMSFVNDRQTETYKQANGGGGMTNENWAADPKSMDLSSRNIRALYSAIAPTTNSVQVATNASWVKANDFAYNNFTAAQVVELTAWQYGPDIAKQVAQAYMAKGATGSELSKALGPGINLTEIALSNKGAFLEQQIKGKVEDKIKSEIISKLDEMDLGFSTLKLGTLSNEEFSKVAMNYLGVDYSAMKSNAFEEIGSKLGVDLDNLSSKFDLNDQSAYNMFGIDIFSETSNGWAMVDSWANASIGEGFESAVAPGGIENIDFAALTEFNDDDYHMSQLGYANDWIGGGNSASTVGWNGVKNIGSGGGGGTASYGSGYQSGGGGWIIM